MGGGEAMHEAGREVESPRSPMVESAACEGGKSGCAGRAKRELNKKKRGEVKCRKKGGDEQKYGST